MVSRGPLALFDLGADCSISCCLTFGCLGENTLLFLELYPFTLRTPFVPGRSCRQTLFLPCEPGGFCGFSCGTMGLKEGSFGVGSGVAAIGEIIFSDVFQISVPS